MSAPTVRAAGGIALLRPQNLVWLALAFILIALVANPLVQLVSISFEDPAS